MEEWKSAKSVWNHYQASPKEVRESFPHFESLREYPWDVVLAYLFFSVEKYHHFALYCGAAKMYRTDANLTWLAVQNEHMTRERFRDLLQNIYREPLPAQTSKLITNAEKVRDKVIHGKIVPDSDMRNAVARVISYAGLFNDFTSSAAGVKPFSGSLKGFKGSAKSLDKDTSRLVLKGLGFNLG